MEKIKIYINKEVADICRSNIETVKKYAQNPDNGINFAGTGKSKVYIWFPDDIERFKNRVVVMGRPKK